MNRIELGNAAPRHDARVGPSRRTLLRRAHQIVASAWLTTMVLGAPSASAQAPDAIPPPPPPYMPPRLEAPSAVTAPAAEASPAPKPPEKPPSKAAYYDLLTFYKDNYVVTGFTSGTEVKFQFSAKFDLWPNDGPHAVYFGFSEKSIWDLYKNSAPFVENNYNPDLFYTYFHHPGRYDPPPGCAFFSERVGVEHESNGLAGSTSRAWNRLDVESRFSCYGNAREYGIIDLKVWAPPVGTSGNSDITKYLGYGELSLSTGIEGPRSRFGGADLTVVLRKGTGALAYGSVEVDARWRPPYGGWWRFTPYLYGQFFGGDGETLLNYDHAITAIRVGIGLADRSARAR